MTLHVLPRVPRALLLPLGALLLLTACNPGAYPIDIFTEMHYQPSHRRLEPERLAPPPDAVPVTGATPNYTFDEASSLVNPLARSTQTLQHAADIYRVNCSMCHGMDGRGQTVVAAHFRSVGFVPPADLTSPRVQTRTDGQLYWIVGHGLGNMPRFGPLLSDTDLWSAVLAIRQIQGR